MHHMQVVHDYMRILQNYICVTKLWEDWLGQLVSVLKQQPQCNATENENQRYKSQVWSTAYCLKTKLDVMNNEELETSQTCDQFPY